MHCADNLKNNLHLWQIHFQIMGLMRCSSWKISISLPLNSFPSATSSIIYSVYNWSTPKEHVAEFTKYSETVQNAYLKSVTINCDLFVWQWISFVEAFQKNRVSNEIWMLTPIQKQRSQAWGYGEDTDYNWRWPWHGAYAKLSLGTTTSTIFCV